MPTPRTKPALTPEQDARLAVLKAKANADRKAGLLGPPMPADIDFDNGTPYYFEMLAGVAKLKKAREAAGLSVADVAEAINSTEELVTKLETGKVLTPTWQTLARYAVAVGCDIGLTVEPRGT